MGWAQYAAGSRRYAARSKVGEYVGHWIEKPNWELIRLAWASVAVLAVAPLQDVMGLGTEARMNMPGVADGHWAWRFRPDQFPQGALEQLTDWTVRYGRAGKASGAT